MRCDRYRDLMMGYLDDELDAEQKREFEDHISGCEVCSGELEEFRKLKQITDGVSLVEPEDRIWQDYWAGVYNRIERGLGWILLSIAGIFLVAYGGFRAIEEIIRDHSVGIICKVGLLVLIAALAILLVSVLRERLYFWRRDRYRNVRR